MDTKMLSIRQQAEDHYLGKPNVVGVAIGYKTVGNTVTDELSTLFLVEKKLPMAALADGETLPQGIGNVPTDVVQVEHLVALKAWTSKWRPAPGGVSIGHYKITAGTLGVIVTEKGTGIKLILSNNHVLANSNDADLMDAILQPGPYDGGTEDDKIASLYRIVGIDFGEEVPDEPCPLEQTYVKIGNWFANLLNSNRHLYTKRINAQAENYVDAALAIPDSQDLVDEKILEIGYVSGTEEAFLGMQVTKSGRTTGNTKGRITGLHATVTIVYGGGRNAVFKDQIISGAMSQGGDSGSLLVEIETKKAVGLLYAGSSQVTIYNRIQKVEELLGIEI